MSDNGSIIEVNEGCKLPAVPSSSSSCTVIDKHTSDDWTIQIKVVGEQQEDFTITLHPDDDIMHLYDMVTDMTGIPREQQRLIYRGRLLPNSVVDDKYCSTSTTSPTSSTCTNSSTSSGSSSSNRLADSSSSDEVTDQLIATKSSSHLFNQRIKDIVGLMNGHSIHLVRRAQAESDPSNRTDAEVTSRDDGSPITADPAGTSTSSASSSSSSSLLSALIGMGSNRSSSNTTSQRRPAYRRTADDYIRPDPGSLETVRQGLMTFHTLQQSTNIIDNSMHQQRHFHRGQWIDCRDTVNQWLEATVVRILYPQDIMYWFDSSTESSSSRTDTSACPTFQPTSDPPIAVTDFDGRRRLLLEPCSEAEADDCIDGIHYRRRSNNDHVQILHIHYNGWPVRWDEWIRSDSERIRLFRTRTRHATTSSSYASPNIDSEMVDAPQTYFTSNEADDRHALLPELSRTIGTLQNQINHIMSNNNTSSSLSSPDATIDSSQRNDLPWLNTSSHNKKRTAGRAELEALATMIDRLGRVMIDAAPHIQALSEISDVEEDVDDNSHHSENDDDEHVEQEEERNSNSNPGTLSGLLSLLSRDQRNGQSRSIASSNAAIPSVVSDIERSVASSTTDGIAPMIGQANSSSSYNIEDPDDIDVVGDENEVQTAEEMINHDYRDFSFGLVNTTQGNSRSSSSSSRDRRGSDDETTHFLSAYLAAMSLGGLASINTGDGEGVARILRDRGSGTGIDIHIHAVVTSPGLEGAIGLAALNGGGGGGTFGTLVPVVATPVSTNTTTPTNSGGRGGLFGGSNREAGNRNGPSRRFRSSNSPVAIETSTPSQNQVDSGTDLSVDDLDLFADLYSETPDPIDPIVVVPPTSTIHHIPVDDDVDHWNSHPHESTPVQAHRSRNGSMRRLHPGNVDLMGDPNHGDTSRGARQDRNSNLLRRIFRRPDGSN